MSEWKWWSGSDPEWMTHGPCDTRDQAIDGGPWFLTTPAQANDLETRIKKACDEWQAAHGLVFTTAPFSHTRNDEYVALNPEDEEKP